MTSLMIKKLIVIIVLCTFCSTVCAQEIKLYKAGTTLSLTEDLHCMTNEVALKVSTKLKLLPKECELKISEIRKLSDIEIDTLERKLVLQKKESLSIISEKDKAVDQIQLASIDEISKIESSLWWKIALGVLGGAAVGAGVTVVVMTFME